MSKFNYIVFFKKDTYNRFKTYPANYNRYASHQNFEKLDDAIDFAKTVNGEIRLFNNTMTIIKF